jgi:hypothetical protein
VVERRQASALRFSARRTPLACGGWNTRLPAFRFLYFFVARISEAQSGSGIQARRPFPDFRFAYPGYLVGKTRTPMRRENNIAYPPAK